MAVSKGFLGREERGSVNGWIVLLWEQGLVCTVVLLACM